MIKDYQIPSDIRAALRCAPLYLDNSSTNDTCPFANVIERQLSGWQPIDSSKVLVEDVGHTGLSLVIIEGCALQRTKSCSINSGDYSTCGLYQQAADIQKSRK